MYQDKLASLKRQLQQLQEGRCATARAPQCPLLQAIEVCEFRFCLGVQARVETGLFVSSVHGLLSLIKE